MKMLSKAEVQPDFRKGELCLPSIATQWASILDANLCTEYSKPLLTLLRETFFPFIGFMARGMLYDGKKYQARMEKISNRKKTREVENKFCNPFSGVMERSEHSQKREKVFGVEKRVFTRCDAEIFVVCFVQFILFFCMEMLLPLLMRFLIKIRTLFALECCCCVWCSQIFPKPFSLCSSIIMTTHVVLPFISETLFFCCCRSSHRTTALPREMERKFIGR